MLCATLCITMVLNSCRIHAEFMLISCWFHFHLNFHNASCNTLHNNGVEFMLNSCWIQAKPWKIPRFANNLGKNLQVNTKSQNHWKCMNSAWIWHESDMNGNIMLHVWICMNSAWIQHEFNMNSTPCCSPNIYWNCQNFLDFLRRFGLAVWIWSQKNAF